MTDFSKLRVAVSYPTTVALVEKVGVLFDEIHLIGFQGKYANDRRYRSELQEHGIKMNFVAKHYSEINPFDYDLLIDSWETRFYNPEWCEYSLKWNIPRIIKILWTANPILRHTFNKEEMSILNRSIVSPENITLIKPWENIGFNNVIPLLYTPGKWWFDIPYKGDIKKVLFNLALAEGRDTKNTGYDNLWKELIKYLPEHTYHHDGAKNYKTARELSELSKRYRCFTNLDIPPVGRPLCLLFTEMLCAGIPPIVLNFPELDYIKFIKNDISGFICNDIFDLVDKVKLLLSNYDLAIMMSKESLKIAENTFSYEVVRNQWDQAIAKAIKLVT